MIISLLIILALGGLAYWAVNRLPITAPRVKQVLLILIVVVAALLMLGREHRIRGRELFSGSGKCRALVCRFDDHGE